jgi:hypothetical protein
MSPTIPPRHRDHIDPDGSHWFGTPGDNDGPPKRPPFARRTPTRSNGEQRHSGDRQPNLLRARRRPRLGAALRRSAGANPRSRPHRGPRRPRRGLRHDRALRDGRRHADGERHQGHGRQGRHLGPCAEARRHRPLAAEPGDEPGRDARQRLQPARRRDRAVRLRPRRDLGRARPAQVSGAELRPLVRLGSQRAATGAGSSSRFPPARSPTR